MAFDEVNEHNVYLCTGQPLPIDISKIVEWMLNEDFSTAYQSKKTTLFVNNFMHLRANWSSSLDVGRDRLYYRKSLMQLSLKTSPF